MSDISEAKLFKFEFVSDGEVVGAGQLSTIFSFTPLCLGFGISHALAHSLIHSLIQMKWKIKAKLRQKKRFINNPPEITLNPK
jgi:hypothetical protein